MPMDPDQQERSFTYLPKNNRTNTEGNANQGALKRTTDPLEHVSIPLHVLKKRKQEHKHPTVDATVTSQTIKPLNECNAATKDEEAILYIEEELEQWVN